MKSFVLGIMATALLAPGLQPAAQESLMDYVINACEADMEKFCSQVTPGEGRLLYCAAAHEDKLSGECSYALYQAASLLEQMAAAVAYVATECKTDIESLCGGVKAGEGRILSCLADQKSSLSDSCKTAIDQAVAE